MPYAAPTGLALSALTSVRNIIVNGDCFICQRSPAEVIYSLVPGTPPPEGYTDVDNIGLISSGLTTGAVGSSQQADHPILGANGFSKSIRCTTTEVAVAATENAYLAFDIEVITVRQLLNQLTVLSFWVKSPKTGIHYCAIQNESDTGRVMEYRVNQSNTWEQKLIGINWNYPTALIPANVGVRLCFPLIAGNDFQQANINTWLTGLVNIPLAGPGQQNFLDTIGNIFRVTDVQIEVGVVNTPFDRLNFEQSLHRCERYYWHSFPYGTTPVSASGIIGLTYFVTNAGAITHSLEIINPTAMITATSNITTYNPDAAGSNWRNMSLGANSGGGGRDSFSENFNVITNGQVAGDLVGNRCGIHFDITARPV